MLPEDARGTLEHTFLDAILTRLKHFIIHHFIFPIHSYYCGFMSLLPVLFISLSHCFVAISIKYITSNFLLSYTFITLMFYILFIFYDILFLYLHSIVF